MNPTRCAAVVAMFVFLAMALACGGGASKSDPAASPSSNGDAGGTPTPWLPLDSTWASKDTPQQLGPIQVKITRIALGKVDLVDRYSKKLSVSEKPALAVHLTVHNTSEVKIINYCTWSADGHGWHAIIRDEYDNVYEPHTPPSTGPAPVGASMYTKLRPGEEVTDVLVFDPPLDRATMLRLELPGANIYQDGTLKFRVTVAEVKKK
jgi:hypothetical protein